MKSIIAKKWSLLIIAVLSILMTGLFGMLGRKDGCHEYFIDESGRRVSPVYDVRYDDPIFFDERGIAEVDKRIASPGNNKETEDQVYFIDKEFNVIGNRFFNHKMVLKWDYNGSDIFVAGAENGIEVLDEKMNVLTEIPYDMEGIIYIYSIINEPGANGLFPIKDMKSHKWGYININGDMVIQPMFESADSFTEDGIAIVSVNVGERILEGAIDEKGNYIIEPNYVRLVGFHGGRSFARVDEDDDVIVINVEEEITSDNTFDNRQYFGNDKYIKVKDKTTGLYGYIDASGEYVIEPQYEDAYNFEDEYAIVKNKDGLYGCINELGEEVISCKYSRMGDISDDTVTIEEDGKWGIYSIEKNDWIIKPKYKKASSFHDGYAVVSDMYDYGNDGLFTTGERSTVGSRKLNIHELGTLLQSFRSYHTSAVSRLFGVMMHYERKPENNVGTIKGDLPILFHNEVKDKYGYVDKNGKVIIKEQYGIACEFYDIGVASVGYGNYCGNVINANGDVLTVIPEDTHEANYQYISHYVDVEDKVIFYAYWMHDHVNSESTPIYVVADISGKVRVEITEDQITEYIGLHNGLFDGYVESDNVKELKEQYNFSED